MLEEIYESRKEKIDLCIKNTERQIADKLNKIDETENKKIIEQIEENFSIKMSQICKEIYIRGLKDGMNIIIECKQ